MQLKCRGMVKKKKSESYEKAIRRRQSGIKDMKCSLNRREIQFFNLSNWGKKEMILNIQGYCSHREKCVLIHGASVMR